MTSQKKLQLNLSPTAVGDDEVAGVLRLDVGAVERDCAAASVRHLRLAAVVRQLQVWCRK